MYDDDDGSNLFVTQGLLKYCPQKDSMYTAKQLLKNYLFTENRKISLLGCQLLLRVIVPS